MKSRNRRTPRAKLCGNLHKTQISPSLDADLEGNQPNGVVILTE